MPKGVGSRTGFDLKSHAYGEEISLPPKIPGAHLLGLREVLPSRRSALRQWHGKNAASHGTLRGRLAGMGFGCADEGKSGWWEARGRLRGDRSPRSRARGVAMDPQGTENHSFMGFNIIHIIRSYQRKPGPQTSDFDLHADHHLPDPSFACASLRHPNRFSCHKKWRKLVHSLLE